MEAEHAALLDVALRREKYVRRKCDGQRIWPQVFQLQNGI